MGWADLVSRRNCSQTRRFIQDGPVFKFCGWREMGIEAVQAVAGMVTEPVIDNDGPAQKIIDNIDQSPPVQRWDHRPFGKMVFVICIILETGKVEALMEGWPCALIAPPFIGLGKAHSRFKQPGFKAAILPLVKGDNVGGEIRFAKLIHSGPVVLGVNQRFGHGSLFGKGGQNPQAPAVVAASLNHFDPARR